MWAEVSPDGSKLWTQQDNDLLVYDMSEISAANAAPVGPELEPTKVLDDAVPPSGITGATFFRGRLYVAGSTAAPAGSPVDTFQVWSIDPADGTRAAGDRAPGRRRVRGPRRIRLARRNPPLADPADPLAPG